MAGQRSGAKTSPTSKPAPTPPYYIATKPLCIGGNPFARAHQPGDRVPVEHVELYGWRDGVRAPDGFEAPASPKPTTEPETSKGQATSKEGEA